MINLQFPMGILYICNSIFLDTRVIFNKKSIFIGNGENSKFEKVSFLDEYTYYLFQ